MNTAANKANIGALVAILSPVLIWALNRFAHLNLDPGENAMLTAALGGLSSWLSVYHIPNAIPATTDSEKETPNAS